MVSQQAVIKPLIPPSTSQRAARPKVVPRGAGASRRSLPLPSFAPRRTNDVVYGLGSVDDRGRVAEVLCPRAMGWRPGVRLLVEAHADGHLVVCADAAGGATLTRHGHLRLPPAVRRWCGLDAGDRVLLAASPAQARLVVYPPAVLDGLLSIAAPGQGVARGQA